MAISIRLDPLTEHRLEQLALLTNRSKSYYLRELIESGLDDLEDFYLADSTMMKVRKGQEKLIDASQARKELGLDN
jgi:RHH-type rel operon transcriptional repressor/antitoxin RelB